jgi:hypothetical protein
MRQFLALMGLAMVLAASAACEAHAGVKIKDPSSVHHVGPPTQAQPGR